MLGRSARGLFKLRLLSVADSRSASSSISSDEEWRRRLELRKPTLQRDEKIAPKLYYAPEWDLEHRPDKSEGPFNHLKAYETTPEKWEYYNKVVWPPDYKVTETGLPKKREIFHCRESIHFSPKRMWTACQFVWEMNVDEALKELDLQQTKAAKILSEVLTEAKERAHKEMHVEFPGDMYVAEAFPQQSAIVKGARRHAREDWHIIRYRYIHVFVRLEEGPPPPFKGRYDPDHWKRGREYYDYLRSRRVIYSI